jgi:hypothetical protein
MSANTFDIHARHVRRPHDQRLSPRLSRFHPIQLVSGWNGFVSYLVCVVHVVEKGTISCSIRLEKKADEAISWGSVKGIKERL